MGARPDNFAGVRLSKRDIRYRGERGDLRGARATVEAHTGRMTAESELFVTDSFSQKSSPAGSWYVTIAGDAQALVIEGAGFTFMVSVDANGRARAKRFAAKINKAARKARAPGALIER